MGSRRSFLATESRNVEQALERLPARERWMPELLRRIERIAPLPRVGRALDVGAAQGLNVVALRRLGWEAVGVEPAQVAIDASEELADRLGVPIPIVRGVAEDLPFDDQAFDLVIAQSVLEHVTDVDTTLAEVARVLRPGGAFFFHTTNALCPMQSEIARFPLFPWYPDALKRRIMRWAVTNRPEYVGFTDAPALNWFTPWSVRSALSAAGFSRVADQWELKVDDTEYLTSARRRIVRLVASNRALRVVGDVFVKASAYVAVK